MVSHEAQSCLNLYVIKESLELPILLSVFPEYLVHTCFPACLTLNLWFTHKDMWQSVRENSSLYGLCSPRLARGGKGSWGLLFLFADAAKPPASRELLMR